MKESTELWLLYKVLGTCIKQYKVVLYYSMARTNAALCQLSTYFLCLESLHFLQLITSM